MVEYKLEYTDGGVHGGLHDELHGGVYSRVYGGILENKNISTAQKWPLQSFKKADEKT